MEINNLPKVNLSEFPRIGSIHLPRSIDLSGVASSVTDGATSVASGATESLAGAAAKASSAADAAANEASDKLTSLEKTLKSELPAFYTVGLWSYCKGNNTHATFCSSPSVSFTFNMSGILNSVSNEMSEIIPDIDEKVLTGYHEVSNAVTWLYIFGFLCAAITTLLAIRKIFFNGGSKLLIIFGMVIRNFCTNCPRASVLIVAAFLRVYYRWDDCRVCYIWNDHSRNKDYLGLFWGFG